MHLPFWSEIFKIELFQVPIEVELLKSHKNSPN